MRWLYKLENKHGKYYISNLMRYIVGGMVLVYLAQIVFPFDIIGYLTLSRAALLQGQVWRLVTFIFVPENYNIFWFFIGLYFDYIIGTSLEQIWGGFRFNVYYLIGIICAIFACLVSPYGYASNYHLNLSMFLAFATLVPDTQFMLFFVVPIKAKWLSLGYVAFTLYDIVSGFMVSSLYGVSMLVLFAFSLVNYILFCGPRLRENVQDQIRIMKNRRNWRNRNS